MNNIIITIKKELRAILRDKKSLMMMLVIPIMIPLYIILFSYVYDDMMKEDTDKKDYLVGVNYELSEEEKSITNELSLETKYGTKKELSKLYEDNEITAYIIKEDNKYTIYSNTKEQNSAEVTVIASQYLDTYNYMSDL